MLAQKVFRDNFDDRSGLKVNLGPSTAKGFPMPRYGLTERFKDEDERNRLFFGTKSQKRRPVSSIRATLPPLVPLGEDYDHEISSDSFLSALKEEEPEIKNPEVLHRSCYDAVKVLKAKRALDKYALSEDEAAVTCAIPILLGIEEEGEEESFSVQKMVELCKEKAPSKLLTMMLTALRKLPRYRGLLYFEGRKAETKTKRPPKRTEGEILQPSFCVASKAMVADKKGTKGHSYREVFRVEDGWGYDLSDFILKNDERGHYDDRDFVLLEPWRTFEVADPGIRRPRSKTSIVPLRMVESELIYEDEIAPNVSVHAIKALRERIEDVEVVKGILSLLSTYGFDIGEDTRKNFKLHGGIECLLDCYGRHQELVKEVISCLANVIEIDGENVYIWFGNSFIQILSETTFKNIEDSEFCQKSSYVFSSITKFLLNIFQVSYLISEAKTFELFSGLLFSHRSNEEICGNTLYALDRILYTLFRMESFGWDLKQAFETCLFDVLISIMEKTKNERTAFLCMSIFDTIRDKGLKMVPDPYKDDFIQLSRKATETYNKRIEPLSSDECELRLLKNLGQSSERVPEKTITDSAISTALDGVGVANLEAVLSDCKEVIEPNRETLWKRYLHSEEEAVLITTYTYSEDNGGDEENTPYRKLNTKLWGDNIQDQIDNPKSYLRLLLRALRKLPRTKPQTLFRGVKNDEHEYKIGEEFTWKGFSSTSTNMSVTKLFLTNKATRKVDGTLFEIRGMRGYSISDFSKYPSEQEILLEPMLKFVVKSMAKQDDLTIVVVEPVEQPLLFEDDIPPGCIQHIIYALHENEDSKEDCVRLCNILSNVYMDDYNSPDSRRAFREYGGVEMLCELFEKHKDLSIANAFAHAIDSSCDMDGNMQIKKIMDSVGRVLSKEDLDEKTVEGFLDFLISLQVKSILFVIRETLVKGLGTVTRKFIGNKHICMSVLELFKSSINNDDGENEWLDESAVDIVKRIIGAYMNDSEMCNLGFIALRRMLSGVDVESQTQGGKEGVIEIVMKAMSMHISNEEVCSNDGNITRAGNAGVIEVVVKAMNTHPESVEICGLGCDILCDVIENGDNAAKAGQLGIIEVMTNAMSTHLSDGFICENGCEVLKNIICCNADNKSRAVEAGAIEVVVNVMRAHIIDQILCLYICSALWSISEGNPSIQEEVCEKGGLLVLLEVLERYADNTDVLESCCGAIGVILSSQKTHSKYCTPKVLDTVRNCSVLYEDDEDIEQFLLGLIREEDPRVRYAVSRGVCTKEMFPKCSDECECDDGAYCSDCCVQQKAFRCLTCDKGKVRLYCETCIKRDHQGHEWEEFFYPVRCGTK